MKFRTQCVMMVALFLIVFSVPAVLTLGVDNDSVGTVEIDANDPEEWIDLDVDDVDHAYESDKLPTPTQTVYLSIQINYVDNTSGELTVTLYYDNGTNLASWHTKSCTYDNPTDTFRSTLGPYSASTTVYYYITCFDGDNTIRTPIVGYVSLIWDFPPTDEGGGAGEEQTTAPPEAAFPPPGAIVPSFTITGPLELIWLLLGIALLLLVLILTSAVVIRVSTREGGLGGLLEPKELFSQLSGWWLFPIIFGKRRKEKKGKKDRFTLFRLSLFGVGLICVVLVALVILQLLPHIIEYVQVSQFGVPMFFIGVVFFLGALIVAYYTYKDPKMWSRLLKTDLGITKSLMLSLQKLSKSFQSIMGIRVSRHKRARPRGRRKRGGRWKL